MNIYTIYRAVNIINGKSYIGFDSDFPKRIISHKRFALNYNSPFYFHSAIRKYGWDNFEWEILYQSKDKTHTLNEMENYFIVEYNTFAGNKDSNGYNSTLGGEGISPSEFIKQKRKESCIKNFGVETPLQSKEIFEKYKQTCLELYGVENVSQIDSVKQKKIDSAIEKFGVENVFQSEEIKEKIKQTNLEKYGVENPQQSKEIKDKIKATTLKNYGVDHPNKREKICCYCNELKNIQHEPMCKLNPNRKIINPKCK